MNNETTVTSRFVDFAHELRLQDIPHDALLSAKKAIVDWAGVTLAGSAEPLAAAMLAAKQSTSDNGGSTVVGHGVKTSVETAALVNGASAHALDFDDYLAEGVIHGSAPLVAALLAVGEARQISGEDFLIGFVAGYEAHAHLSTHLGEPLIRRGFHPTGVLTHVGTGMGVGKMIRLPVDQMSMCLGIAATQSAGLLASFGTMSKPLHSGKAAADGVLSALLAESGYTGSPSVLDGDRGLPSVMAGAQPAVPLGVELGQRWLIIDNAIKPYAACGAIHAAIDAALELSGTIDPQAIEHVECAVSKITIHAAGIPMPATGLEGKFSTQYAVAAALLGGASPPAEFTDDAVRREVVRDLTMKVTLTEAFERITEASVRVTLADGSSTFRKIDWAKGSPHNPMDYQDTVQKFLGLAVPILGEQTAARVISMVETLEHEPDVSALAALLRVA